MTKTIKMSLAAAVAVSALTSSASAGNLEEMIKGTTLSGKAEIGYDWSTSKTGGNAENTNEWEYDLDATLNTKINDTMSAQIGFQADHEAAVSDESTARDGEHVNVSKLQFTAKTDMATIIVGKQTQPTPFLNDERGDGVVALIPAGPVTIAAGHFDGMTNGQDLDGSGVALDVVNNVAIGTNANLSTNLDERDITALAAITKLGPVDVTAWYLTASGAETTDTLEKGVDGWSLNLKANVAGIGLEVAHATLALDANADDTKFDDESLTKIVASFDAGNFSVYGGYGMTNDAKHNVLDNDIDSARLHGADLTHDDDAATNMALEYTKLDRFNDAKAFVIGASMPMGAYTFGAHYLTAKTGDDLVNGDDTKVKEINLETSYSMSSNFTISGLYAHQTIKPDGDKTKNQGLQLSLLYTF